MRKLLFLRGHKHVFGGHIKLRDYFLHCMDHPQLDPYVYFPDDTGQHDSGLWDEISEDRVVTEIRPDLYDLYLVAGKQWHLVPEGVDPRNIIHLFLVVLHDGEHNPRRAELTRPAVRICASQGVYASIAPYVNGELVVIHRGIPLELFRPQGEKRQDSILILAKKNKVLGKALRQEFTSRGLEVSLITQYLPRAEYARLLRQSDIFVALPLELEGFYIPALEGMASNCAVICSDAIGNRGFCVNGQTCLMPAFDHYESHVNGVEQLLGHSVFKEDIRRRGFEKAVGYSLQNERTQFYSFLEDFVLSSA